MGQQVAGVVAGRFGRSILELGGNNAAIVAPSADIELVVRGMTFAAAGTAGQRCTSLRRAIVHESRVDEVVERMSAAYASLPVGSPLEASTLVGPLITSTAFERMQAAIETARADGGAVAVGGERLLADEAPDAAYVHPTIVTMPKQTDIVADGDLRAAAVRLDVRRLRRSDRTAERRARRVWRAASSPPTCARPSGSARPTAVTAASPTSTSVRAAPRSAEPSAARRPPVAGRESGSDAWKAYMRRATNTINYSNDLPLAQGVKFG